MSERLARRALLAGGGSAIAGAVAAGRTPIASREVRVVRRFFELLHRKDIDGFGRLWHTDGTILVFYPPDGFPSRIEGREEIVSGFRTMFEEVFDTFQADITAVYPVERSDTVIAEYSNRATLVDGTVYTNDNIAVFRFADGLVRWYHDYFDPRRYQVVVDFLNRNASP